MEIRTIDTGIESGEGFESAAGWIDMDGCTAPEFRLSSATDGSTLADVTAVVQEWVPSP